MTSRLTSSRVPTGTAANPVRRNLFHGIRRPTGSVAAAGASTASNNNTTSMPEMDHYDDGSDIVMRDQNGDPQFQTPQVLPLDDEQNGAGHEDERERRFTCFRHMGKGK